MGQQRFTTKKELRPPDTFRHGYCRKKKLDNLMAAGAGAAPEIIYVQGVSIDPSPDLNSFNRKKCSIILIEVGFCKDLACHEIYTQRTDK